MNNDKFCCLRPNFCSPCEIEDFRKLPTGYIYAIDTAYAPDRLLRYYNISERFPELLDFNEYKWKRLVEKGLVVANSECAGLILVRPRGARESQKIHKAYFVPEFHGDLNTCTFCMNNVCLRHAGNDVPTFCNHDYKGYADSRIFWGAVNRDVIDAWLPKQYEMRKVLNDYIQSLTRWQKEALLHERSVPIGEMIATGLVEKEIFSM